MKKILMVSKLFIPMVVVIIFASLALAVPQYINYQGVLQDSSGDLVTGTKTMRFEIYDAATAGNLLSTTTTSAAISNGLYNVQIGPVGYAELGSGRRWLEVSVSDTILSPRLEILSVAYAVTAATAESAANAYKLSGYSAATTGSGSFIPVTTSGKLDSSVIPSSSLAVSNADYATLAGTATIAAYATVARTATTAATATSASLLGTYEAALSGNNIIPITNSSGKLAAAVLPTSGITADSAETATTANYATVSGTATSAASATTATSADSADYATTSGTATSAASATSADSADYATVSGTATTAATATNANAVDGLSASTEVIAGQILALDANKQLKGMSVSAEANDASPYAMFINGPLGASAGGAGTLGDPVSVVCGIGTIASTNVNENATVYNSYVTTNSKIFITAFFPHSDKDLYAGKWLKVDSISAGSFVVEAADADGSTTTFPFDIQFFYLVIN